MQSYSGIRSARLVCTFVRFSVKVGKGSGILETSVWVPELIPVLGSQPAGDRSHKSGSRLP